MNFNMRHVKRKRNDSLNYDIHAFDDEIRAEAERHFQKVRLPEYKCASIVNEKRRLAQALVPVSIYQNTSTRNQQDERI